MTDKPFPVTYKLEGGATDAPPYITFLGRYLPEVVKGKPTGEVKLDLLPVRFSGAGREVAEASAIAFWEGEIAKIEAKKERGRALGESSRKRVQLTDNEKGP